MRTVSHLRFLRPLFYVVCAVLFLAGCSSSSETTSSFVPGPGGGIHPADWGSTHPSFAVSDVSECTTCHGDDLTGGIANTSCFTAACHHEDPGWASAAAHGATAKRAPGNSGFKSCQICHGDNFSGGGSGVSCFLCHATAPHPSQWRTGDTYVHTSADSENASVCAQCHLAGANSPIAAPPSPAPGAQPGCFNDTLCHGTGVGHPSGWMNPASHGTAAKGAPSGSTGFAYCQACHASDFSGGGSGVSCYPCHGANAPHPANWRTGDTYVHTSADSGNASVCAQCHLAGANSPIAAPPAPAPGAQPGCFNSTLCHGSVSGHPSGWSNPDSHGAAARGAPSASAGFAYCQVCHGTGTDFAGGSSGISCYTCHGANAPHPASWRTGDTYSHTNAVQGNAPVCAQCHLGGANSPIAAPPAPAPGAQPGCFNSTLCHGSVSGHPSGWSNPDSHGAAARGAPSASAGFAYCQVCHGTGTDFAGGSSGISCYTCHGASAPHPANWRTGDTYVHTSVADGNASVCAFCHANGANSPIAAPPSPAPGAQPGCFNNTLCHGAAVSHLVPFLDPDHLGVNQAEFDGDCSFCHAVSGSSPNASAPSCQVCHTAGSPLSPTGSFGVCTSCHGYPPDGAVGTYPNVAGAHLVHLDLDLLGAGTPVDCDTCHLGLGFVTQAHYDRANGRPGAGGRVQPGDLAFDTTYNAQSGASSFDNTLSSLNCSNVSCHGGQTTPNFQTGTINVNTQCTSCHAYGTGQFNSYRSGEHDKHVNEERISCTECHNTTTLAVNHFRFLSTQAMEGPASATVGGGSTGVQSYSGGSCSTTCHGNERWQGGD